MADIIDIEGGHNVGTSRTAINTNFENLNTDKAEAADLTNVENIADADKVISDDTQVALDAKLDTILKGNANGVAELGSNGQVPAGQLPTAIAGGLNYLGTWDADTNTPELTSGSGTNGDYWTVSVAGSESLDGISSWGIGDWVISNDTPQWQKIDNTQSVVSVNTKTGAVVLTPTDLGLGSVENTTDAEKVISDDTATALLAKANAADLTNVENIADYNKVASFATEQLLVLKADKTNVLEKDNTTPFTPDEDYEPATKKYVDDNAGGGSGTDEDAIHDNVAGEIAAVTLKETPVSADLVLIEDSEDSNNKKRITLADMLGGGEGGGITLFDALVTVGGDYETIEDAYTNGNKRSLLVRGNITETVSTTVTDELYIFIDANTNITFGANIGIVRELDSSLRIDGKGFSFGSKMTYAATSSDSDTAFLQSGNGVDALYASNLVMNDIEIVNNSTVAYGRISAQIGGKFEAEDCRFIFPNQVECGIYISGTPTVDSTHDYNINNCIFVGGGSSCRDVITADVGDQTGNIDISNIAFMGEFDSTTPIIEVMSTNLHGVASTMDTDIILEMDWSCVSNVRVQESAIGKIHVKAMSTGFCTFSDFFLNGGDVTLESSCVATNMTHVGLVHIDGSKCIVSNIQGFTSIIADLGIQTISNCLSDSASSQITCAGAEISVVGCHVGDITIGGTKSRVADNYVFEQITMNGDKCTVTGNYVDGNNDSIVVNGANCIVVGNQMDAALGGTGLGTVTAYANNPF